MYRIYIYNIEYIYIYTYDILCKEMCSTMKNIINQERNVVET